MLKRFPFHPFAFAVFPILTLLAYNIQETYPVVAVRSLLVSVVLTGFLFLILRALLRDWFKAAVAATLLVTLFFLYGHLYYFLRDPILGLSLSRHRLLVPLFAGVFVLGLWLVSRKIRDLLPLTGFLNLVGVLLVVFPLVQLGSYAIRTANRNAAVVAQNLALAATGTEQKPDIYYFLLDTYTRADSLKANFNFDNGPFLEELRSLGFYVADCSRSNYRSTRPSLASSLNLDYLPKELARDAEVDSSELANEMIQDSLAESELRALGYRVVAFQTGYAWTEWKDADYFFRPSLYSSESAALDPFESILLKTTALQLFSDLSQGLNKRIAGLNLPVLDAGPFQAHVQRQLYVLEALNRINEIPGPKFVFVHMLTTHSPLVFGPNGEIVDTPCFFGQDREGDELKDCVRRIYPGSVAYTNKRLLEILQYLLESSSIPPVIILQGDHGVQHISHYQILNAYYLPEQSRQRLYPTISPVNSFRFIFSEIFGADYPLLPDHSLSNRDYKIAVPEDSPACLAP